MLEWWNWKGLGNWAPEGSQYHQRFSSELRTKTLPLPTPPLCSSTLFRSHLCPWDYCMVVLDHPVPIPLPLVTSLNSSQDDPSYRASLVTVSLLNVCWMTVWMKNNSRVAIVCQTLCSILVTQHTLVKTLPVASDKNPIQINFSPEMEFIGFRRVSFRHSWVEDLEKYHQNWHSSLCLWALPVCVLVHSLSEGR